MAEDNTAKCLDDVKKLGKPRRFVMICKGVKILSLIAYKKGTVETYRKLAKEKGNGQFYHGVIDGKGENVAFNLCRSDGYEKPPGKELTLKDHIKSEFGIKLKPIYKIVEQLPDVPEDDDPTSEPVTPPTFDTSAMEAKLDALASGIKAFVAAFPDRRVEILKPTKVVKDFLSEPAANKESAAKQAMAVVAKLVGEVTGNVDVDTPHDDSADIAARLKVVSGSVKEYCVQNPDQKKELLGWVKQVKDYVASPSNDGKTIATAALERISGRLNGAAPAGKNTHPDPNQKKWTAAAKKMAPLLKSALAAGQGDVGKMRAVFAFAREKAEAGDYQPALKALVKLKQLIDGAVSEQDSPQAAWENATRNARFQIRRLQTGLELFSKEMEHASAEDDPRYGAVFKHALSSSLTISGKLDGVVEQIQTTPKTQSEIDAMKTYLQSDLVRLVEGENPFGLEIKITEPLTNALQRLKPAGTASV